MQLAASRPRAVGPQSVSERDPPRAGGELRLLPRLRADGTPAAPRSASAFSQFVQTDYASTKAKLGRNAAHAEVMRALSTAWREKRQAPPGDDDDGDEATATAEVVGADGDEEVESGPQRVLAGIFNGVRGLLGGQ